MALKGLGLKKLGYVAEVDFKLENDGAGDVIKEWLHGDAQPSDSATAARRPSGPVRQRDRRPQGKRRYSIPRSPPSRPSAIRSEV